MAAESTMLVAFLVVSYRLDLSGSDRSFRTLSYYSLSRFNADRPPSLFFNVLEMRTKYTKYRLAFRTRNSVAGELY